MTPATDQATAEEQPLERVLLVHHDPGHDDAFLASLGAEAADRGAELGGLAPVALGREGEVFELGTTAW